MGYIVTVDQAIALISSLGACGAAIATFLTVRQIAKQREDAYRPELVLSRTIFKASKSPLLAGALPTHWLRMVDEIERPELRFGLPLSNIGFGTAKNVIATWRFPIEDAVSDMNKLLRRTHVSGRVVLTGGGLSVEGENIGKTFSMWRNQNVQNIDYVLPAAERSDPQVLALPHAYILAVSTIAFLAWAVRDQPGAANPFLELPLLTVALDYYDVADRQHRSVYEISFNIIMWQAEAFDAYLEPRKRTT